MNAGPQPLTAGTDAPDGADWAASPYPGLRSFGAADESLFFGRAELLGTAVRRFWQALDEPERSAWMWAVGPSGSGKTSLLQAGLCPRLDTVGYAHVSLTPGADPMGALAGALATHLDVDPVAAVSGLADEPSRWLAGQRGGGRGADTELVLVVDRFEDLFRLSPPDQRRQFVDTLLSLSAPGRASRCVVVAALDVAFYAQAADDPGLAASLPDAQVLVAPLRDDQLRMAVMEPARATGYVVDDDLAELILADAATHEGAAAGPGAAPAGVGAVPTLPLVAHALRETWQRATGRTLTAAAYREAGGLDGAVEASAEALWADLDSAQRRLAGQIIGRLTEQRGEDLVPVTLPAPDLAALGDRTAVDEVVDRFVDAGLLTTDGSGVEVGHAALLSVWRRAGTLARDHTGRRRVRPAGGTPAAADPTAPASPPTTSPSPSSGARVALQRRLDAVRRGRRERRREGDRANDASGPARVPWPLVAVAAVVALGAVSVAAVVGDARRDAETERDAALARETASTAEELQTDDPALGVEVAVAGHSVADTTESRSALLDAASGPMPARWLGGPGPAVVSAAADGDLVAVGDSTDATVQIFTVGSGEGDLTRSGVVALQDLPNPAEGGSASGDQNGDSGSGSDDGAVPADDAEVELAAVALTPDGNLLVTGDSVGRVALWDVTDSDTPELVGGPLEGPAGPVRDLAVSPDGAEVAVAADGDALLRWSLEDPADPEPLAAVTTLAAPSSVAYSSELPVAAVGTEVGTVQVWNLAETPDLIEDRAPAERPIRSVAFAPEGGAMAAAGRDGELYLWDISDGFAGAERVDLDNAEFDESVNSVAFSPDGEHVVAGSADRALRVWSTGGGRSSAELMHPAAVTGATFQGDGHLLSTTGDGTTRAWDLARVVPFQVSGQVRSMAATLDGDRLAVASTAEARVWEVDADGTPATGDLLARVDGDVDGVGDLTGAVDLSPSGDLLALGADGADEVHLVDVTGDGPELLSTAGTEDADAEDAEDADSASADAAGDGGTTGDTEPGAVAVAFSPAGQVAAAGRDGQVHLWRVNAADEPVFLGTAADATDEIRDLTWGPEGDLLAVTSADGRVYLYGVDARGAELTVAFDGVAGSLPADADGDDAGDGDSRPVGDAGPRAAAFTGTGDRLVTVGVADGDEADDTGVLLVWDLDDPTDPRLVAGPVPGPPETLVDVAVDPTDELVAAAALDGTSWVWELPALEDAGPLDTDPIAVSGEDDDVPDPWLVLGTGEGPLRAVEFGPEGEILRAGRDDGRVRAWPLVPEDAAAEICEAAGDPVSPEEWAAHLPGLDYEPPC